jgi:hypothetical protein
VVGRWETVGERETVVSSYLPALVNLKDIIVRDDLEEATIQTKVMERTDRLSMVAIRDCGGLWETVSQTGWRKREKWW